MKLLEKTISVNAERAKVLLGVTLCALALLDAAAAAHPVNITQDDSPKVAAAKHFVGSWRRITPEPPADNAYVFLLEGDQLKATVRTTMYEKPAPGSGLERKLVWDNYSSLSNVTVEGGTLTWKLPLANSQAAYSRASLVSEDDLLVENCGKQPCSPDRPVESKETLKRQSPTYTDIRPAIEFGVRREVCHP
jgi:hypothetical protein